uniref:Uncharacterized protein n=3 Tax=Leersia perrieri TaxID=77586 RepID=A0A0D9XZ40_9ORYZ
MQRHQSIEDKRLRTRPPPSSSTRSSRWQASASCIGKRWICCYEPRVDGSMVELKLRMDAEGVARVWWSADVISTERSFLAKW